MGVFRETTFNPQSKYNFCNKRLEQRAGNGSANSEIDIHESCGGSRERSHLRFLQQLLCGAQKRTKSVASYFGLIPVEPVYCKGNVQNGNSQIGSGTRVDDLNRSQRCLQTCYDPAKLQKIPAICVQRTDLPIQISPHGNLYCTPNFQPSDQRDQGLLQRFSLRYMSTSHRGECQY